MRVTTALALRRKRALYAEKRALARSEREAAWKAAANAWEPSFAETSHFSSCRQTWNKIQEAARAARPESQRRYQRVQRLVKHWEFAEHWEDTIDAKTWGGFGRQKTGALATSFSKAANPKKVSVAAAPAKAAIKITELGEGGRKIPSRGALRTSTLRRKACRQLKFEASRF